VAVEEEDINITQKVFLVVAVEEDIVKLLNISLYPIKSM
jgi:hypothetical protein